MTSFGRWKVPKSLQPRPDHCAYDLDRALSAVVGLSARVPGDAFTAETLGTERAGNGVVIAETGLVVTIGYLITEAESLWLSSVDGRLTPGHALAYDFETGFGLVQALGSLGLPALPIGDSAAVEVGDEVVVAGSGGREGSLTGRIVARQPFAGYWEYALDEALFAAPSHPHWGGTALIGQAGELLGVGSLQVERGDGEEGAVNMFVPIDLLKPILTDLRTLGRPDRAPRPWLGLYAGEIDDHVVIAGLAPAGPAAAGGLEIGDLVVAVGTTPVHDLAGFYHGVWGMGPAGALIPLTVLREGRRRQFQIASASRQSFLKAPRLH